MYETSEGLAPFYNPTFFAKIILRLFVDYFYSGEEESYALRKKIYITKERTLPPLRKSILTTGSEFLFFNMGDRDIFNRDWDYLFIIFFLYNLKAQSDKALPPSNLIGSRISHFYN